LTESPTVHRTHDSMKRDRQTIQKKK